MAIITAKSRWSDLLTLAWERIQALNGFTRFEQCPDHVYGRDLKFRTVGEAFERAITPGASGWSAFITLWMGLHVWDVLDDDLRTRVVKALAEQDPAAASILYRQQAALSDEHDKILWTSIAAALPTTARKLEGGTTLRAKDTSRG